MTEELKKQIRLDRIRTIVDNRINKLYWRNRDSYTIIPKPKPVFFKHDENPTNKYSLKDVTEADIEEWKTERIKEDCVRFLGSCHYEEDKVYKLFKDMDVNDVLIETYKLFLIYSIKRIGQPVGKDAFNKFPIDIDNLEEMHDKLNNINEKEKTKKRWWEIF